MKSKILQLVLIMSFLLIGSLSTNAQTKLAFFGNWSFDAPSAPDGYTYGIIEIKKDTVNISFTDLQFKYPSTWVKIKNDSLTYAAYIDGTDVLFSLKIENETNIKGNAVWSDGQTQMILKKKTE